MADLVKTGLTLASAAYLYHAATQEKIFSNEKVTWGTIGALTGLFAGPKLEKILKEDNNLLTDEQKKYIMDNKKKFYSTLIGAGLGGGAGYLLADGAADYVKKMLKAGQQQKSD